MTYVIVGLLVVAILLEAVLIVGVAILITNLDRHEEAVAENFRALGVAIGGILSQFSDSHGEHLSTLEAHSQRISTLVEEISKPKQTHNGGVR